MKKRKQVSEFRHFLRGKNYSMLAFKGNMFSIERIHEYTITPERVRLHADVIIYTRLGTLLS
jgi:hypothetical protein